MNKLLISAAIVGAVLFSGCTSTSTESVETPTKNEASHTKLNIIDYKKAKGMNGAGSALFIDARGAKLYKKGTILGSMNLPVKKYNRLKKLLPAKNTKIVTFCNGFKCEKSDELAVLLMNDGYTRVMVYKGGYPEWKEKKQPLMGIQKKCKPLRTGPYKPKNPLRIINGAKIHLGGEKASDGMVDQFWLASLLNKDKIPANIQLVDIRKSEQFKEGHLPNAINVVWDSKKEKIDYTKFPTNKLIVFYCNTGMQSTDARGSLSDEVAKNVLYLDANVKCTDSKCTVEANEDE